MLQPYHCFRNSARSLLQIKILPLEVCLGRPRSSPQNSRKSYLRNYLTPVMWAFRTGAFCFLNTKFARLTQRNQIVCDIARI